MGVCASAKGVEPEPDAHLELMQASRTDWFGLRSSPSFLEPAENSPFASSVAAMRAAVGSRCGRPRQRRSKPAKQACNHPYVHGWKLDQCSQCDAAVGAARGREEASLAAEARREDAEAARKAGHSKRLWRGGITVQALEAFTHDHNCWDWETWRVVRDIVKPARGRRGAHRRRSAAPHCLAPSPRAGGRGEIDQISSAVTSRCSSEEESVVLAPAGAARRADD